MAGAVDFQTAFNNAVNSGGGFSTDGKGNTTLTDKSGKVLGVYNTNSGTLVNSPAPSNNFSYNHGSPGSNWNGTVGSAPSVSNFGVSYKDPSDTVNLNQANNAFQNSGLNSNQQNNWMQAFINAQRQDGGATSSSNAVQNNWNMFNQDKQPDTQDSYLLQGPTGLKSGQSELMTNSGTGQAYYVANMNGQLYKGAVPDALSPQFGNNGQANVSIPSVWNPDGSLKSMGTGSLGSVPDGIFGSRSAVNTNTNPAYNAFVNASSSSNSNILKPNAPSPGVSVTPMQQAPTITNMVGQQVPVTAIDPNANNMYLNPYWTQIQQQGHTSRELQTGENLTNARNQEAQLYNIQPNQVNVVNSGGKTYLQVPWQLAQNHAYTQSANEQAQQQQQTTLQQYVQSQQQQPNISSVLQQLGVDPATLNQQAQQEYQTQANSINQIIQQDQQQQQAEDALLQTQLNDAVGQQNNTSFQDWLKAREGIAQRGLGNSGFLNDAMVRNQLNNEDKMQGIYNTAMDNQQKSDATYQGDIAKQQQALANLSPASMFSTLYDNAMKAASPLLPYYMPTVDQQMTNQASMLRTMLPYEMLTADQQAQQAFNQSSLQEKAWQAALPYQQMTADQLATLSGQLPNGQLTLPALTDQAKIQQAWAQLTGQLPSGAPTVDEQKLQAQVSQWNAMDSIDITKNNISAQSLAEKTNYDQQIITDAQQTIHDTQTNDTLGAIKSQMDSLAGQMNSYRSAGQTIPPDISNKYQSLLQQAQQIVSNKVSVNWSGK